ncbi:MAG: N-acetylmuramoyl-L-alanine amidase [Lachnospirales bacterium]
MPNLFKTLNILNKYTLSILLLLSFSTYFIYEKKPETKETFAIAEEEQKTIFIDVGHGGSDPGYVKKVSGKEIYEKDINLKVAEYLVTYLQELGYKTEINRTTDTALASTKNGDMAKRVTQINSNENSICVSIHQNSFTNSSAQGAQVFYHTKSKEGKLLAAAIQKSLKENAHWGNKKNISPNKDYYMLRKTKVPAVIVECGFMSNPTELQKLLNPDYQKTLAKAISIGIDNYLNN